MATPSVEVEAVSVVLSGSFNPSIFQPAWLSALGLVSKQEAEGAIIQMIHSQVSSFRVGPYALQVENNTFQASTAEAAAEPGLKDLVVGIFSSLEHTPISALGINRSMHYRMPSEAEWHNVGHQVVPKALWSEFLQNPGTLSVTVQGTRPESNATYVRITLQPSNLVLPGVFVSTNEHFQDLDENKTARSYLTALQQTWATAQRYARHAADIILSKTMLAT